MATASTVDRLPDSAVGGPVRRFASWLHRHAWVRLGALLSAPMAWFVLAYLGSLVVLLISSLWTVNTFTGQLVREPTLENFRTIFVEPVYRNVAIRSVGVAAAVTVIDALIALPMAFFMAKVASPRFRHWLVIAILTPLWASYLVKTYSWRVMLGNGGPIDWMLGGAGRGPGYGLTATIIVLAYLWLPYMILPIYAGLDRLPNSLLEACSPVNSCANRRSTTSGRSLPSPSTGMWPSAASAWPPRSL